MRKNILLAILCLFSLFLMASCNFEQFVPNDNENNPNEEVNDENSEQRQIYNLAVESGYKGTYEDWLESIRGDEVVLQVSNGEIQWKYSNESSWKKLISLKDLSGEKGETGVGIEKVEYDANGNLVITFTNGTTQTIIMPEKEEHVHTFGEWTAFTDDDTPCERKLFFHVCNTCNIIEWKQGTNEDHDWEVITTAPTCQEQGFDTNTCSICGKVEIDNYKDIVEHFWEQDYFYDNSCHWIKCNKCDEIKDKGEHVYDEANVIVNRVSTCIEHGIGTVACGCGATTEIDLPLDLTNHEGHWNSQTNTCDCGSLVNNLSVSLSGADFHYVNYTMDGTQDFEFDALINVKRNESSGFDWGSGFTGEIFSQDWLNGGWSYRTDWIGWGTWTDGGKATYTDVNTGLWNGKFPEATALMDIVYNLKYNASENTITIKMTYISHIEPYSSEVKELTYVCNNVMYKGSMIVGFGGQNADITFKYLKMISGEMVPQLDGQMNDAVWQGVTDNVSRLVGNNGSLDLHYVKGEKGIYFHGYYRVKASMQPAGGEWWQNHNFEFKLLTANGILLSSPRNDQWLISNIGVYRADSVYFGQPVADGEYNVYQIEMYITYGRLGITKDTEVGIMLGMNICGQEWIQLSNWGDYNVNNAPKIPASV